MLCAYYRHVHIGPIKPMRVHVGPILCTTTVVIPTSYSVQTQTRKHTTAMNYHDQCERASPPRTWKCEGSLPFIMEKTRKGMSSYTLLPALITQSSNWWALLSIKALPTNPDYWSLSSRLPSSFLSWDRWVLGRRTKTCDLSPSLYLSLKGTTKEMFPETNYP